MADSKLPPRTPRAHSLVRSVARASTLLHLLADRASYVPLGELASAAGLPKSTAHGLLQTLVSERLVEHDSTCGCYRLSPRLVLRSGVEDGAR
jgi:DNA-binding IclR family transcriptional regulator